MIRALSLLLGLLLMTTTAWADVPELDDVGRRNRAAQLERRAKEWLQLNTRVLEDCGRCRATGRSAGGRCSACAGAKRIVKESAYMRVHHAFRSPAFRAQPSVKAEIEAKWKTFAPRGRAVPGPVSFIDSFEFVNVSLLDQDHGIVRAWVNERWGNPRTPKEFRWVLASERSGAPGQWYLYDRKADGPWPTRGALEPYDRAVDLGNEALAQIVGAGLPAAARHRLAHVHKRGGELILTLVGRDGFKWHALKEDLGTEVLELVRRAFDHAKGWERVTVVVAGPWRSETGAKDTKPYGVFEITRAQYNRLQPENLDGFKLRKALGEKTITHWGWTQSN